MERKKKKKAHGNTDQVTPTGAEDLLNDTDSDEVISEAPEFEDAGTSVHEQNDYQQDDTQDEDEELEVVLDDDGNIVYKKRVEYGMRDWLEAVEDCRRAVADSYFVNPTSMPPSM